jgi:nucleotide-binding universal stress UspA family protein
MAKRILVPIERAKDMEFALRMAGMIVRESGGVVRLLAVIPIPKPIYDSRHWLVVSTDQQMERLATAAAERLKRIAALDLDDVPVETSVVFGDRAVEIGLEAECFEADLVVMPWAPRPGPAARMRLMARRLLAGRRAPQFDVLSVSALRAEPTR